MKIGICGIGFVGNAIFHFFDKLEYNIELYDKYKNIGKFENILKTDIIYLCLPTLYDTKLKTYNMSEIDETIKLLNDNKYKGIILIKSTVIPTYCSIKNQIYPELILISNPEFLSAKTAINDFENQQHIIIGYTEYSKSKVGIIKDFYKNIFPKAHISITTTETANLTKLACNSFYSIKIQYFTELYLLCDKLNVSYNEVKELMLNNDWINPMHTDVPGPDGNISFGGLCFPKDINALNQFMISNNIPNKVVNGTIEEQMTMRE
jgi:UDPglucose 6-dehydrogenase